MNSSVSDSEIARHNQLYNRACKLQRGLVILDGVHHKTPGFFGKRRLRKSVTLFQEVIKINPGNWQSMLFIGKAFQSLGEMENALDWFVRAHECVPAHPSVAKEVGFAAGTLGRHDIALRAMDAAAKHNPEDAALQCNIGLSCILSGQIADARKAFERTVELEPQRKLNKQLLALTLAVESGNRPCPKSEADIFRAIDSL